MQVNTDTAFVLQHESGRLEPPQYWVLSKKGDTVNAYKYGSSYIRNVLQPQAIRRKLLKTHEPQDIYDVGINRFFNVVAIEKNEVNRIWKTVMAEQPWNITDDSTDGYGCPPVSKGEKTDVFDAGTIKLFLITPKEIKTLKFYAPVFYEKECPGRKGRQAIHKIDQVFKDIFKD